MCVWLGVERGRKNGATQQFSFQAHQNLIFLGKKHEGKWGVGFLDEIARPMFEFLLNLFFFPSLLFRLFIIYHFFFIFYFFMCTSFFFVFSDIIILFFFFLFFFGAHPFFSQPCFFFFLEKKVLGSLNFLCSFYFLFFLLLNIIYLK